MSQYGARGFAAHGWTYRQILAHYYPHAGLAVVPSRTPIRVLLETGRSSVTVTSYAPIRVSDGAGRATELPSGRYRLDSSLVLSAHRAQIAPVSPVRFAAATHLGVDGGSYRGDLIVRRGANGLDVVNELPLDLYVRGVVCWEMPCRWPAEGLAAQAVAARSYALAERRPGRSFDVYADTRSQMYGGIRAENAAGNAAVAKTAGEVLVWRRRVATTFYSSSSGGRTAAIQDAWPAAQPKPYLVSVSDPYDNGQRTGPRVVTGAELGALLGVGEVTHMSADRNGSGRILRLEVRGAWGSRRFAGRDVARALGIRSAWFTIRPHDHARERPPTRAPPPPPLPAVAPPPPAPLAVARRPPGPPAVAPTPSASPVVAPAAPAIVRVTGQTTTASARRELRAEDAGGHARVPAPLFALALVLALFLLQEVLRRRPRTLVRLRTAAPTAAAFALGALSVVVVLGSGRHPEPRSALRGQDAAPTARPTAAPPRTSTTPMPPTAPAPSVPPVAELPAAAAPIPAAPPPPAAPLPPAAAPPPSAAPARPRTARDSAAPVPSEKTPPAPPPTETAPPLPTETTAPPPAPLTFSDVRVLALAPSGATIGWRTSLPAVSIGGAGTGGEPLVWTPVGERSVDQQTTFTGLQPGTVNHLWLQAHDEWGQDVTASLDVVTPFAPLATNAAASGRAVTLDGQPFFPLMVWAACASEAAGALAAGINVFLGNSCGSDAALLAALHGTGYAVTDAKHGVAPTAGLIGWYYEDEWDTHLANDVTVDALRAEAPPAPQGLVSFLTLTHHFYSRGAPLPQGRGMYPPLLTLPDVVGFDMYPMQSLCFADAFGDVYEAQRELQALSGSKPGFQWIEVAPFDCRGSAPDPSPETVRAETWLAIAGGATGIGYFPAIWTPEVGATIAQLNASIRELAPALLGEPVPAASSAATVKVGAFSRSGATYVIAVNATRAPVDASVSLPDLQTTALSVYGEQREVAAQEGTISDHFEPLAVHVYVAAPSEWTRPTPAVWIFADSREQQVTPPDSVRTDELPPLPLGGAW